MTVDVNTDDVRDVLCWWKWKELDWADYTPNPLNVRWLDEYTAAEPDRKDGLWQNMHPSLQWAVHTYEHDGPWHLHAVLLEGQLLDADEAMSASNDADHIAARNRAEFRSRVAALRLKLDPAGCDVVDDVLRLMTEVIGE